MSRYLSGRANRESVLNPVLISILSLIVLGLSPASVTAKDANDPDLKIRESMVNISRQLGVTCTHCHDVHDFRKSDMPTHKMARSHLEIVAKLNENASSLGGKVDCYMCHRGIAKPDFREKQSIGR